MSLHPPLPFAATPSRLRTTLVRLRCYLDRLAPYHAAVPWTIGAGVIGALAAQALALAPSWLGFLIGYLAMGGLAGWALADPAGEYAIGEYAIDG